jgi:hypothetical protein
VVYLSGKAAIYLLHSLLALPAVAAAAAAARGALNLS